MLQARLSLRTRRVTDKRVKRGGQQCNFYIYYEVDDEEVPTALRLEEYEDEAEYGWVLLAAAPEAAAVRVRVRRVRSTTRWRWTRPRRCTFLQGWG